MDTNQTEPTFQPVNSEGSSLHYTTPLYSEPPKRKKIWPILVILALILIAGGAAAYSYFNRTPVSLPSLISESIDKSQTVTSYSYDAKFEVDFSNVKGISEQLGMYTSGEPAVLSFKADGSTDISNPDEVKFSSIFSLGMGSYSLGGEIRLVDSNLFLKITKIPDFPMVPAEAVSAYKNKWFSIPFKIKDGQVVDGPLAPFSEMNKSPVNKLTSEQKEEIIKITKEASLIKTIEKLSSETLDGESTHHFAFDLDREGIVAYLESLIAYFKTISPDNAELMAFDSKDIVEGLDKIKNFRGEIWIGQNDKLIHKIWLNFGVAVEDGTEDQVKFDVAYVISGYNQPVSVVAPADSVSLESLINASLNQLQTNQAIE